MSLFADLKAELDRRSGRNQPTRRITRAEAIRLYKRQRSKAINEANAKTVADLWKWIASLLKRRQKTKGAFGRGKKKGARTMTKLKKSVFVRQLMTYRVPRKVTA